MVEFNHDKVPLYKLVIHSAQIVLSIIMWILQIVVFRSDGDINGQNGWTFGVCFLSVPAWIYLIMAPRYRRAANIAWPNVLLAVDAIFTVIWFSAFVTQASYNSGNHCGNGCGVSKAIVALGVFETLLWVAGVGVSYVTLQYFNSNGVLPGYDALHDKQRQGHNINNFDPDKDAFSTGPIDEEAYAPLGGGVHGHDHDSDEPEFNAAPYGGVSSAPHHDPDSFGAQNTSYGGAGALDDETSYGAGGSGLAGAGSRYDMNTAYNSHAAYESHGPAPAIDVGGPHAHLYSPPPAEQDEYGHPVTFPAGNYDNIGLRQV